MLDDEGVSSLRLLSSISNKIPTRNGLELGCSGERGFSSLIRELIARILIALIDWGKQVFRLSVYRSSNISSLVNRNEPLFALLLYLNRKVFLGANQITVYRQNR